MDKVDEVDKVDKVDKVDNVDKVDMVDKVDKVCQSMPNYARVCKLWRPSALGPNSGKYASAQNPLPPPPT